ncbi:hypothetical protein [Sphingobacterium cavernae]|uniref:hypothetical protein n=1 Tax=Sphingobacterium cavernae TaxID=2592657 RepID=UPI0012300C19|nr:hypothetical protein [Sphingobacterium cavernae]
MMQILFLGITQFKDVHDKYVNSVELYIKISKPLKALRFLWFYFNLPFKFIWINPLLRTNLRNYDIIIISANQFNIKVLSYIEKWAESSSELILWYWNPVLKMGNPVLSPRWKKVSFDLIDSKNYNIAFNNTYYFKEFVNNKTFTKVQLKNSKEAFFLGQDKGRLGELLDLKKKLSKVGVELILHVVRDKTSTNSEFIYKPKLAYESVIAELLKYNILLDFNQEGQSGLTLRIMEGLFFDKKIITNNKYVKLYDFYRPSNIFILEEETLENLPNFLNLPYEKIPHDILIKYDFPNWLERLVNEK